MPTIYRKTAKGLAEIETRQHRLTPRSRSVLILVDGKRGVSDLKALIPQQTDETLALLLQQGMIEIGAKPGVLAGPTPALPGAAVVDIHLALSTEPGQLSGPDFGTRRRLAVRDVNNILGPTGEGLAIRIERARDAGELQALLQTAAQVISNARGRAEAEAFLARHSH